jgi:hypothetical protein
MIEILHEGTKNRIKCTFCGALLSYQKEDIKEKECYRSQRDSYILKYISCPQCNQIIIMEDK